MLMTQLMLAPKIKHNNNKKNPNINCASSSLLGHGCIRSVSTSLLLVVYDKFSFRSRPECYCVQGIPKHRNDKGDHLDI